jgi:hypothetical protein
LNITTDVDKWQINIHSNRRRKSTEEEEPVITEQVPGRLYLVGVIIVLYKYVQTIIYKNGLPPTINTLSEHVIFIDDTSAIISSKNVDDFCTVLNFVLSYE